jgi:hypothetical protein
MKRFTAAAFALVLAACGGSPGSGGASPSPQTTAQTVASNSGDFPSLTRCPESGSWDDYLKAEQSKDANQYTSDKSDWDNLKAAGANDSYIAVYADDSSHCGNFGNVPSGKVVDIYAIRFKDENAASANFKTNQKDFHLSDSDLQNIQSAGGKVTQGGATGLGDNSVVVELSIAGASFYIAFWQKKNFEVAMIVYNVPVTDGETVAKKVSDRIT